MWDFRNIFKTISGRARAKRYLGLLPGNLPVKAQNWSSGDFLRSLDVSLYTNRAIAKRADKVGEIEFVLHDKNGQEIENDPLINVLYRPNKVFTARQFWSLYQKYYDAIGEVYILVERNREPFQDNRQAKVTALHLLNPLSVTPKFGDNGEPTVYEYNTGDKTIEYKPEQIVYIHNPNPENPLRGHSLLKAGVNAIQTETQISTYHSRVLENGGKVEGVFKFKTGVLTEEELKQVKDRYQKEYGAAKKAGLPLFLGGDADYIKTGLTPEELSFLEAKKMTLEDICILTGVPKSMLASTNDVKFDNADADRAIFLRETIKPLLTILTTALDEKLFPDEKTLTFIDPTPENIEEKRKNIETANTINAITINEKRELLKEIGIELDPISGGDDILIPFNMVPLTDAGANGAKKFKSDTKEIDHPLQDADTREVYGRMQIKRMDKREESFKKSLNEYFTAQEKRLLEALDPKKTRVFRKKGLLDELLKLDVEVKIGKKLFIPVLTDLLEKAGIDALELTGSTYDFVLTDGITSWLDERSDLFMTSINETTFKKLQSQFEDSLAAEEGREKLINRIHDTYSGIKKSRAALIARTEVHNATQYGTMQGYKQGGLTIKIWVAVNDGHTRDSHAIVDGEERPIDRPFSNGLMYPGDPNGPADETINCRCVI